MRVEDVQPALRHQLGLEATDGLLGALDRARREWTEDVMNRSAESFERRLTAEISGLRVEFRETLAAHRAEFREALTVQKAELREAIATQGVELRELVATQVADVRQGLAAQGAELRTAIAEQGAALRTDIATSRADILRWLFIFWTGQLVALAALLSALL